MPILLLLFAVLRAVCVNQAQLAVENMALRQQLAILRAKSKRPRTTWSQRLFWVLLARWWRGCETREGVSACLCQTLLRGSAVT